AGAFYVRERFRAASEAAYADALVTRLLQAEVTRVPAIIDELDHHRPRVDPRLKAVLAEPSSSPAERLHASLALLQGDEEQAEYLHDRLLHASPEELLVISRVLRDHGREAPVRLWGVLRDAEDDPRQRSRGLRAAAALAAFDPQN